MYERLKRLHLPDFNIENWESRIRQLVLPYPHEPRAKPFLGKETADIVYEDSHWALTRHLIEQGYPLSNPGNGKGPTYFIEVKTTLRVCQERFFMLKGQYDMVSEAYIIYSPHSIRNILTMPDARVQDR